MSNEEKELFNAYQKELETCFDIAQRLDSFNPGINGTFTGAPSERIKRQLQYYQVNGFVNQENME